MGRKIIVSLAILTFFIIAIGVFEGTYAAERTMKIRIPQCVCDSTDVIVRSSLGRLEGVKSVDANPVAQSATIVFDDTKTNFEQVRGLLLEKGVTVLGKPEYLN